MGLWEKLWSPWRDAHWHEEEEYDDWLPAEFGETEEEGEFGPLAQAGVGVSRAALLLPSAARTTLQTGPDTVNYGARGILLVLNVTAGAGGSLNLRIQGKDEPAGNVYWNVNSAPTNVTVAGTYVYEIYPFAVATAGGDTAQRTVNFLPDVWRYNIAVGGAQSYTYTLTYRYLY
jgi:hypothetical protein